MSNSTEPLSNKQVRSARLARERSDQILDAAASLFGSKGFHRTTTRDIALAAGVSEGTLYNYFKSKDEMLIGIITRVAGSQFFTDDLDSTLSESPSEAFHRILEKRQHFLGENRQGLQAVMSEILVDPKLRDIYYRDLMKPFLDVLEDHLKKRMDQQDLRSGDPAITARLLAATLNGLFLLNMLGDELTCQKWNILDDSVVELFFKGIQV